jgi:hypothetical protein
MHEEAFKQIFSLISIRLEKVVKWQHLHGEGFGAVVTDMDKGQLEGNIFLIYSKYILNILGFGRYLTSVDPSHRPWLWQVQHTIIYCQIHFQRSIDRAAGTQGRSNTSIHARMGELTRCQSEADYYSLCDELISMYS